MAPGRPFTRETTICEWEEGKGQVGVGTEQPALWKVHLLMVGGLELGGH